MLHQANFIRYLTEAAMSLSSLSLCRSLIELISIIEVYKIHFIRGRNISLSYFGSFVSWLLIRYFILLYFVSFEIFGTKVKTNLLFHKETDIERGRMSTRSIKQKGNWGRVPSLPLPLPSSKGETQKRGNSIMEFVSLLRRQRRKMPTKDSNHLINISSNLFVYTNT